MILLNVGSTCLAHLCQGGRGRTIPLLTSPSRRREKFEHVRGVLSVSERRACSVIGQPRSTQRRIPRTAEDEARLTAAIVELATTYGRYGYRRITALLREAGWLERDPITLDRTRRLRSSWRIRAA